jgi:hypothetical protein
MSAVNLWKQLKLQSHNWFTVPLSKWCSVRIVEKGGRVSRLIMNFRISPTPVNKFSAPFSSLLHKVLLHDHRQTVKSFEA